MTALVVDRANSWLACVGLRPTRQRLALASLLVGGIDRPGADLAEMGRMFARLTDEHIHRMGQLGLSA